MWPMKGRRYTCDKWDDYWRIDIDIRDPVPTRRTFHRFFRIWLPCLLLAFSSFSFAERSNSRGELISQMPAQRRSTECHK